MTYRLGGFARLGLVIAVLWTMLTAWLAFESMPKQPNQVLVTAIERSAERPTVWDPQTKKLLTMAEAERRTREARAVMTETERAAIDASAALPKMQDQIVYVEGKGFISVKAGQTVQDAIAKRAPDLSDEELLELLTDPTLTPNDLEKLTDDERARLQHLQQNATRAMKARRLAHARAFLAYWLLPIVAMFASAHTIRWIYRGFRQPVRSQRDV